MHLLLYLLQCSEKCFSLLELYPHFPNRIRETGLCMVWKNNLDLNNDLVLFLYLLQETVLPLFEELVGQHYCHFFIFLKNVSDFTKEFLVYQLL